MADDEEEPKTGLKTLIEELGEAMRDAAWEGKCTQFQVTVSNMEDRQRDVRVIVVPETIDFEDEEVTKESIVGSNN